METSKLLLTGSASFSRKQEILRKLFNIEINSPNELENIQNYDIYVYQLKLTVFIELNSNRYDECRKEFDECVKQSHTIWLVEQLEPRPTTLISNLKKLNKAALESGEIVSKKVKILFYNDDSSQGMIKLINNNYQVNLNVNILRDELFRMDEMFKQLNIFKETHKREFVINQCFMLNESFKIQNLLDKCSDLDHREQISINNNEKQAHNDSNNAFINTIEDDKALKSKLITVILVGPKGHGKSTLGNKILNNKSQFTLALNNVQFEQNNNYSVVDCPGFSGDNNFTNSLKLKKEELHKITPFDAILFVVQFKNKESISFNDTIKEFWKYFGTNGLKSTIFVCIQCGNMRYSDWEFEEILKKHEAYNFCKSKLNRDMPFILWESLNTQYPNQFFVLENTIRNLETKYTKDMLTDLFDKFEIFF